MTVDINRPDEDTMWKLLKENPGNAVGAILRLSWLQGMTREEICSLTWGDIYTEKKIIALKDREIPLNDDTQQCLHLRITHPRICRHMLLPLKNIRTPWPPVLFPDSFGKRWSEPVCPMCG